MLRFETNSKIVKVSSKSSDLKKFRLALSSNFDRKYCEAKLFNYKFRDWSFDLIKFRLALSVNLDRKYYKSKSRNTSSRISNQSERKKRSIENKEKLLIFSRKINNSLSRLTTINTTRMIKQKFAKRVKICSSSIKIVRDEKIKFFKKNDFLTFVQVLRDFFKVKMYTIYKRKNQQIKLSDICVANNFKSIDDASWKKSIIKKRKYFKDFIDQFDEFLISKFSELTKKTRIKSEANLKNANKKRIIKTKKRIFS
jgi:hypothetical protein